MFKPIKLSYRGHQLCGGSNSLQELKQLVREEIPLSPEMSPSLEPCLQVFAYACSFSSQNAAPELINTFLGGVLCR